MTCGTIAFSIICKITVEKDDHYISPSVRKVLKRVRMMLDEHTFIFLGQSKNPRLSSS